jgi:hypothetical protein
LVFWSGFWLAHGFPSLILLLFPLCYYSRTPLLQGKGTSKKYSITQWDTI